MTVVELNFHAYKITSRKCLRLSTCFNVFVYVQEPLLRFQDLRKVFVDLTMKQIPDYQGF